VVEADDKTTTPPLLPWSTPTITPLPTSHSLSATFAPEGGLATTPLPSSQSLSGTFAFEGGFAAKGLVYIEATRKTRHGGVHGTMQRNLDGKLEFTGPTELCQALLGRLQQEGKIPPDITDHALVKLVQKELKENPDFKNLEYWRTGSNPPNKEIDAKTIKKAANIRKIPFRITRGRPPGEHE
jgi:hypothetical protein